MEQWEIKGGVLEFDEDTHTYIYDGVILPSVTQLLKKQFPDKYAGVTDAVLKRAAERGTQAHKAIEIYCTQGDDDGSAEVRNYRFLEKNYGFKAISNEVPIVIFNSDNNPLCAGRLDMILTLESGEIAIADIKTTATLDKDYLAYQLNLYRLGAHQCYNIDAERLYGLHIREDKRKFVEIPVNDLIILDILENVRG